MSLWWVVDLKKVMLFSRSFSFVSLAAVSRVGAQATDGTPAGLRVARRVQRREGPSFAPTVRRGRASKVELISTLTRHARFLNDR